MAMMTNKQNTLKHGYITQYGGFATVVDTITVLTDAMWELAAKGPGVPSDGKVSVIPGSATYTTGAGVIKAPPTIEESSKLKDVSQIADVVEALTPKGPTPSPLASIEAGEHDKKK